MLHVAHFGRATHSGCAKGHSPFAEDLGVSPNLNSLESLFDKEELREFGARGLKADQQAFGQHRSLPVQ